MSHREEAPRARTHWRDYVYAWEHLRIPPQGLEEGSREREVGGWMDGWKDRWIFFCTFTWTNSFICSRGTVSVSVTHSVCWDTLVSRALKLSGGTHTPKTSHNIYVMII